jgi:hypothetical protein
MIEVEVEVMSSSRVRGKGTVESGGAQKNLYATVCGKLGSHAG